MNRIFGIFVTFLLIPTLPTFGVSLNDIDNNLISKYCRKIAGSGGGNINCSKNTNSEEHILQCSYGLKPNANPDEIKVELAAYCSKTLEQQSKKLQAKNNHSDDNFDFAAASANSNASSGLLLATSAQEDEPQPNQRQQDIESNLKKETTVPTKKPYPQTDEEQKRLVRTAFSKFCKDDGYVYKDNGAELPSIGVLDANCNAPGNGQLYFSCYKFKTNPAPAQEIHKHFAYYCYTNVTTPTKITAATRPSDHYNKKDAERAAKQEGNKTTTKTCPKITAEWKKQNNATAGACDTTTGELYITECKPDYVGATRGIGKDGYKSCTASNLTKIGEKCDTENATSAKYAQVNGSVVCQPTKCKCGYELSNNKCNAWTETSEQCSVNNAKTAKYICENDKKVCKVEKCLDTHYLDSDKNKCIAKSTVKCTQYEDVDDTGKCVAKLDADRSKAEHQESCRNTNGEWTDDNKCKCKKGYKPVDGDPYACEPTEKTATNEEKKQLCEKDGAGKWTDKNKCECTNPAYSFIDDQGCQPDDKKTEHEKHKALCKSPNEWNDRTHKCKCKNTKEFFDEETGCVAATKTFTEAQEKMKQLETQLNEKVTELNIK